MLTNRTCFVLGAGSSCELGLPSGHRLKSLVAAQIKPNWRSSLYFTDNIARAISQHIELNGKSATSQKLSEFAYLAEEIRAAMPLAPSIDNYLEAHQAEGDLVALGKLAIAETILSGERESHLYSINDSRLYELPADENLQSSWYYQLLALMIGGRTIDDLSESLKNFSFIIFNYDRCLEHFLNLAFQNYYRINADEAAQFVQSIDIVHPYGTVGPLPWMDPAGGVPYGSQGNRRLYEISQGLMTFSESASEDVVKAARKLLAQADTVVMMGFGFLQQNVRLLRCGDSLAGRVFLTTMGLSDEDGPLAIQDVSEILVKAPQDPGFEWEGSGRTFIPHVTRGTCSALMADHRLRLSRAGAV